MYYAAAFVLFCLVCTVLAFTRHPIWGLYFYFATTYVFPPARWWGSMLPDLRWAFLSAAITALAILFHRGKLAAKPVWLSHAPAVLLTLYATWMVVQTPWALDFDDHVEGTTQFIKCLFALWFVYRVVDTKEHLRDMMMAHMLGCGLLGVYAQFAGRQSGRLDGVGGPNLDDSNTLGMYLVTGAIVAIGLAMSQRGWRRYLSLGTLVLIFNGFVLANSRGSFLGLVAGSVVLWFCIAQRYRGIFLAFAVVGAATAMTLLVDQVFIERMFTIQDVASEDEEADMSARSRLAVAKAQLQMFQDHPMGAGFRGTSALSTQYLDRKWLTGDEDNASRSSHNTFLTALVEQGILGALIYGALVAWVITAAFRLRRLGRPPNDGELVTLGAALCGALVAVLTAGTTADYLIKEVQFWLYAGLLSVFWMSGASAQAARRGDDPRPVRQLPVATP